MPVPMSSQSEEIERLEREASLLAAEIEELSTLPEKLQRERDEQEKTLPRPDYLDDLRRQSDFEDMATRGEITNRRRAQTRSMLLLILLLAAAAAMLSWLVSKLQS